MGRQTSIHNEIFRDFDETSEGEVQFTDYIRPVCIPCTGTCVTPDELIGSRGEQLLTGDETPEEACAIEGRDRSIVFQPIFHLRANFILLLNNKINV